MEATQVTQGKGWRLHPAPGKWNLHPAARTFQVLRILVNRELGNLEQLLRVVPSCLRPGGRAAVISFHSGEDRLVKAAFRGGLRGKTDRQGGPSQSNHARMVDREHRAIGQVQPKRLEGPGP